MLALVAVLAAAALAAGSPDGQTRAATAEQQYQRAQALEATLETQPKDSRTETDYYKAVQSYRRVLLITPQAQFATPSLVAIGRLYEEMGSLFDPAYLQKAIDTYQSLLRQYPRTRHGPEALYAIARIEQGPLSNAEAAKKYLRDVIRLYPSSDEADRARLDLAPTPDGSQPARGAGPAGKTGVEKAEETGGGTAVRSAKGSRESEHPTRLRGEDACATCAEGGQESEHPTRVLGIRSEQLTGGTRILIVLDGPVKFRSARITEPERAYFDLSRAYLAKRSGDRLALDSRLVKSVLVAQNRRGVVRVVLDISTNAIYSASLLRHPYGLAIDVGSGPAANAGDSAGAAGDPGSIGSKTAGTGSETTSATSETDIDRSPPASLPGTPPPESGRYENGLPGPAAPARPTRTGATSLTRELGLKIGRIVIDAGHGGFDTGTIGPTGLQEKDVCLDVARRLGRLIERRLRGAEVVYTRGDDSFVPLETRTEIANEKQADLFVSIHANSSPDAEARGIETYYLNFTTSPDAMAVAARENAPSQESVHQLQDLLKKISLNDKIQESRELAADVDQSLMREVWLGHVRERDRGVKKAPFVVLIGAHMPSILSEISFLSNPTDERLLKSPRYRQRIAEGLFNGIERYLGSLNSLSYNRSKAAAAAQK